MHYTVLKRLAAIHLRTRLRRTRRSDAAARRLPGVYRSDLATGGERSDAAARHLPGFYRAAPMVAEPL